MPVFADYHTPTSYSFSYYYSPYSLSSRMSNALYSVNSIVPKSLITSTAAANRPPSSSSLHHYYPSRPISIDATTIDVTSARLPPVRKPNAPAAYGQIHRGRTVIRLKMPDPPDIGGIQRRQKSPGRKLIEKFTIPERPRRPDDDDSEKTAFDGTIRRHISANRRKSSLAAAEDGIPVAASRKCSITEELLKEEEAIFDTLIMEEIARTNGVPDRRNSFDCLLTSDLMANSRKCKPKRHSVDFNATKGLENSQSLNDFIEKLNADISRSGSLTFSTVDKTPPGRDSFAAKNKSKTFFNWSSSSSTTKQNLSREKITTDVIDKKLEKFAKVEKKDESKMKTGDAISSKRAEVDKTMTELKAISPTKTTDHEKIDVTPSFNDCKTATLVVNLEKPQLESPIKNVVPARNVKKESHSAPAPVAAVEVPPATTNIAKPAAPVKAKSNPKTTNETIEQPTEKSAEKLESPPAKPKPKQDPTKKQPKKVKKTAAAKTTVDKCESNTDETPIQPHSSRNEKLTNENGTGVKKSTKKSAKKSVKKKRKSIDWKMVDVGLAEFNDEITEINGWSPEEDSDYTSDEDSSECDSDEESDDSSSSESDPIARPYSCRHKIVHQYKGRIIEPASTIPRFKKYTVHDFNFIKVLGKGSFGKVLLAVLKESEYYYAVKCLKKDVILEDDDIECTLIERKVLTLSTKHPYLCHLFCTFQTQSHLFFVMEFLNGGDLMFHIQQSGRFDEGRARFYAAEIISGLRFLHKKGIVYRDLKLDNILLDCNGHIRIADFGMCKLQIYLDKTVDTFCGTPDYMAPEIIKGLKYNQCVDWWSFGILLYEMLIGKSPFRGCDEDSLFWSICHEQPQFPRFVSARAKSLLSALLQKDATKRLGSLGCNSGDDVMAHEFFINFDWVRLERKEMEPPYKPRVFHPLDTHYFDRTFTKVKPRLTPIQKNVLESMDQSLFRGFCYTNPNATEC